MARWPHSRSHTFDGLYVYDEPPRGDGRAKFEFELHNNNDYTGLEKCRLKVTVEREIVESTSKCEYRLNITATGRLWPNEFGGALLYLYFVTTADLDHIRRRDTEDGCTRKITLSISSAGGKGPALAATLNTSLSRFLKVSTDGAAAYST